MLNKFQDFIYLFKFSFLWAFLSHQKVTKSDNTLTKKIAVNEIVSLLRSGRWWIPSHPPVGCNSSLWTFYSKSASPISRQTGKTQGKEVKWKARSRRQRRADRRQRWWGWRQRGHAELCARTMGEGRRWAQWLMSSTCLQKRTEFIVR